MEEKKGTKKGLGQGLSALLGDYNLPNESVVPADSPSRIQMSDLAEIDMELIDVNPWQPRTEFEEQSLQDLSESIKILGLIQPITVTKNKNGRYQIISGERRVRASKLAGLTNITAYIRTAEEREMLEMALAENIQREDLNPMEIALSYQRLLDEYDYRQEDLANRVSKSRSEVSNYLRLLKLCPEVQSAVSKREITMGHAKMLAAEENKNIQITVLNKILSEELSVRQVEDLMRKIKQSEEKTQVTKITLPQHIQEIKSSLKKTLDTKVDIKRNLQGKGNIIIGFSSDEELEKITQYIISKSQFPQD